MDFDLENISSQNKHAVFSSFFYVNVWSRLFQLLLWFWSTFSKKISLQSIRSIWIQIWVTLVSRLFRLCAWCQGWCFPRFGSSLKLQLSVQALCHCYCDMLQVWFLLCIYWHRLHAVTHRYLFTLVTRTSFKSS